jgi:excisionase family DNA binding protein
VARRWLNSQEAAEYLGLKNQTLANWRYLGKGPRYFRVGQLVKYDERDLEEWLEAGAVAGDRGAA